MKILNRYKLFVREIKLGIIKSIILNLIKKGNKTILIYCDN